MVYHAPVQQDSYHLYAILPFIELSHEKPIHLGPVVFWPSSLYETFLPSSEHRSFKSYLKAITQLQIKDELNQVKTASTLLPKQMTCISLDEKIAAAKKEFLLVDSIYLLYFACTFRDLYYGFKVPSFDGFRKILPASAEFLRDQAWETLFIEERQREPTISLHLFDETICQAFGKMLTTLYLSSYSAASQSVLNPYQRLIRAIRYIIDRFTQRFINLFDKGLVFSIELFEPEDIIFLAASYESLFDIQEKHPSADFKNKLRPLLHLKYSRPVELFWRWADDFYEARRKIMHGDKLPDPIFRMNPNFEVSHAIIGLKLFIYSVYYMLFKNHLIHSEGFDVFTPPDFKWIHPEELLLLFWTEESLLNKLEMFMRRSKDLTQPTECYADIHFLSNLFIAMQERYVDNKKQKEVKFISTPLKMLKKPIQHILDLINQEDPQSPLMRHIPPELPIYLMKRL